MKHSLTRRRRAANAFIISLGVAISPVANAMSDVITVKLGIQRNARDFDQDNGSVDSDPHSLERGAEIEIEKKYVVRNADGNVNFELTLNKWLRKAQHDKTGEDANYYKFKGDKKDAFFPVKIVKSSRVDGEGNPLQGQTRFVALSSLLRVKNGLTVAEDSIPLAKIEKPKPVKPDSTKAAANSTRPAKAQPASAAAKRVDLPQQKAASAPVADGPRQATLAVKAATGSAAAAPPAKALSSKLISEKSLANAAGKAKLAQAAAAAKPLIPPATPVPPILVQPLAIQHTAQLKIQPAAKPLAAAPFAAPAAAAASPKAKIALTATPLVPKLAKAPVAIAAPIAPKESAAKEHEKDKSSAEQSTEFQTTCPPGGCPQDDSALAKLKDDLAPAFKKLSVVESKLKSRTDAPESVIAHNFKQSCGFDLKTFLPMVREKAIAAGYRSDFFVATIVQESMGKCFDDRHEKNRSQSVGLFQVSNRDAMKNSRLPRCSAEQKADIKQTALADMEKEGPHCLENPVLNLNEAIRVMDEKFANLTAKVSGGFDRSKMRDAKGLYTKDAMRLAASAYNGGETYVKQAKRDLDAFNSENHTKLSAYKWEDIRLFYFRRFLSREDKKEMFDDTHHVSYRSKNNILENVAYAENLIPRDSVDTGLAGQSLAMRWDGY
jgi:hypothetical protein